MSLVNRDGLAILGGLSGQLTASGFARLAVRANTFAAAAVSPIVAIESISQAVRVTTNDLGSSRLAGGVVGEASANEGDSKNGCFVPKLTKIASTARVAVQSSGDGCVSPVTIPVGGGGEGGGEGGGGEGEEGGGGAGEVVGLRRSSRLQEKQLGVLLSEETRAAGMSAGTPTQVGIGASY